MRTSKQCSLPRPAGVWRKRSGWSEAGPTERGPKPHRRAETCRTFWFVFVSEKSVPDSWWRSWATFGSQQGLKPEVWEAPEGESIRRTLIMSCFWSSSINPMKAGSSLMNSVTGHLWCKCLLAWINVTWKNKLTLIVCESHMSSKISTVYWMFI